MEKNNCSKCNGSGKYLYASTSTYIGGMGGSRMTLDLCDICWGSGDRENPFKNIFYLYQEIESAKIKSCVKEIFHNKQSLHIESVKTAMNELIVDLNILEKKRNKSNTYKATVQVFLSTLRRMVSLD